MAGWTEEERGGELPPVPEAEEVGPRELYERRHRAALRYFEAVPPYCIRPEADGMLSLCRKRFHFTALPDPVTATRWTVISRHAELEEAERRLRLLCGPKLYYDERGRITGAPPGREDWEAMQAGR